jgi:hypothetical protein
MDDPPAKTAPLRLTGPPEELYGAYYRPIISYVTAALQSDSAESVAIDGVDFKVAYDADLDLYVGLAGPVIETEGSDLERIQAALAEVLSPSDAREPAAVPRIRDEDGREWSVGADGVIVRLGERWQ